MNQPEPTPISSLRDASFLIDASRALTTSSAVARAARSPYRHRLPLMAVALSLAVGLSACGKNNASSAAPPATPVHVATVASSEVTDWDVFTGRFEAVEAVKLRPRVSGYIDEVKFAEGKPVKKGDVLFVIDPRPYRVQFERAQAEFVRAKARAELAQSELGRSQKLLTARAVSQEEFDQRASEVNQAHADQLAARAAMEAAKLDLDYTQVTAPIDGRVSRAEITAGNYVTAGQTILTSVVSLDPIYVYFEGDEQTYLKYADLAKRGERPSSRDTANPVFIGLANETDFPHAGKMDFVDNALNPETGTIRARALLANPEHLFTPGMLARVKLQGSGKYTAALIEDEAVATDQDRKYVMVVNAQNVVEYRSVELSGVYDNRRIVRNGLQAGERVVVGGLQRVRPGMTVAPQEAAATANTPPPADLKEGVRKVALTEENVALTKANEKPVPQKVKY